MSDSFVISLRNVSKNYRLWSSPSARLLYGFWLVLARFLPRNSRSKENLTARANRLYTDFAALSALSLDVRRGECLGIIGRNGAGKSTLLQLIAGTLQPSTGEAVIIGRVAALLELGSGFNPDFTGRENIYLNATILGLSRAEIEQKYDAIVAYSGIEEFIDRPVRTYSSGMTLRLAFSVCVHVDADVIIIDEALAVGDARFQFKCHATLDQKIAEGCTIIFVSHDTNSVKRLCQTGVLLERGELLFQGSPNDVVNIYTKLITSPHGVEMIRSDIAALRENSTAVAAAPSPEPQTTMVPDSNVVTTADIKVERLVAEERSHQQVSDKEYAYGGDAGVIEQVSLSDDQGMLRLSFVAGSEAKVQLRCRSKSVIHDPIYAVTIKDIQGQEIFGTNTYFQNLPQRSMSAGEHAEALFTIQLNILPGVYFISVGWVRIENGEVQVIHRRYDSLRFDVLPRDKSFGIAYCPTQITVRSLLAS
jgi:ABC-type polysaccharide/polyol phosphate transport system ATPase subunit